MQKIDFDRQVQSFAVQLIGALSALAPVIIIASMLGAFAWLGYMDTLYFKSALPSPGLAILGAIFLQSMRFGTALGSVRMFRAGKIAAVLFLAASLLLTYLESGHVITQAAALASTPQAIKANVYLIKIAVWASIGLELLVAILFNGMYAEHTQSRESDQADADPYERQAKKAAQEQRTSSQGEVYESVEEILTPGNGQAKTKRRPL